MIQWLLYALLFYFGVKYVLPVFMPFLFGLGVAALVQKPAALLSQRIPRLNKKVCCVCLTAAVMLTTAMLIAAALCSVCNGAMDFCPGIPDHLSHVRSVITQSAARSGSESSWGRFVNFIAMTLEWCIDFFTENYQNYLPSVLRRSTRFIAKLPSFLTAVFFGVVSALFACGEFDQIKRSVKHYLPAEIADTTSLVIRTAVRTVALLLKTYGTLMLITMGELVVGLTVIRLAGYPTGNILTNALVISFIDILPILGTGTVLIPWGVFEILTGNVTLGVMILVMFAVIGGIRNFLEPKFMAHHLQLPPFFTLAGVYIGGKLFGAAGIVMLPLLMLTAREMRHSNKSAASPKAHSTDSSNDYSSS